ncbi:hypothetical protein [Sphingomonas prati]|uniref:Uncharacterized protein n=1 Tax=Sphingomonas prati TaxID=1843237 RepID=A0A7W9BTH2_9SPHN|nr:hypothetical protein [Sphingomonas prati]MBB5729839.1 hypothetical protein [Sphingomonas prati]
MADQISRSVGTIQYFGPDRVQYGRKRVVRIRTLRPGQRRDQCAAKESGVRFGDAQNRKDKAFRSGFASHDRRGDHHQAGQVGDCDFQRECLGPARASGIAGRRPGGPQATAQIDQVVKPSGFCFVTTRNKKVGAVDFVLDRGHTVSQRDQCAVDEAIDDAPVGRTGTARLGESQRFF